MNIKVSRKSISNAQPIVRESQDASMLFIQTIRNVVDTVFAARIDRARPWERGLHHKRVVYITIRKMLI